MLSSLSPRRRRAVLALVAVVLLAVAVPVAAVLGQPANRRGVVPVAQDRPGPVLLVPGYGGSAGALSGLAERLRAAGRRASVVTLPGAATGDLRAQARALGAAAQAEFARGAPSLDVVGFSAGGVVVRLWVKEYGGARVTRRVITLGSPHHGADLATLGASLGADACPVACQQLVPGSTLLRRLNAGDETPDGPGWVTVWSSDDGVVTPPESARLAGAIDVKLQSLCPGVHITHGDLARDPLPVGLVLSALSAAPLAAPSPADCR